MTAHLAYTIQSGADYGLPCFWILILVGGDGPTSTNLYSFYFRLLGKDKGLLGVCVWRPLLSGYCLAEDSLPLCCGLLCCCDFAVGFGLKLCIHNTVSRYLAVG